MSLSRPSEDASVYPAGGGRRPNFRGRKRNRGTDGGATGDGVSRRCLLFMSRAIWDKQDSFAASWNHYGVWLMIPNHFHPLTSMLGEPLAPEPGMLGKSVNRAVTQ